MSAYDAAVEHVLAKCPVISRWDALAAVTALSDEPGPIIDLLVGLGVLARGLVCGADITPIPSNHEAVMLRGKTTVELAVEKDDLSGVVIGGSAVVLLPKRVER